MIYDNIWKVTADVENDCTGCLLDYPYFKKYYMIIAIDRRNQQALDADPRAIEKINIHYWRSERNCFEFFIRYCESIVNLCCFNIISS